jgi:hypothetical protein
MTRPQRDENLFNSQINVESDIKSSKRAIVNLQQAVEAIDTSGLQPLDSDLTAIAALTTTAFGRAFLTLADATASRTYIGAAASSHAHAQSDVTNLTTDLANKQPLDSDLTSIAALTTTAFGRAFLALADAAATRTTLDNPCVKVRHSTTQSIPDNVETALAFNTLIYDSQGTQWSSGDNTKLVCKEAGVYHITGAVQLDSLAATPSNTFATIRVNGSAITYDGLPNPTTGDLPSFVPSMDMKLAVNDYAQLHVYQETTANTAVNTWLNSGRSPHFAMHKVGEG